MRTSLKLKVQSLKLSLGALVIILAGLFMGSCGSGAKKAAPVDQTKESGVGKLVFSEENHNFGSLKAGEVVSFTFVFRNEGTKALTITSIDSGCDCLEVKVPNKTIEPGQEGQMEVIYNSAGEVGRQLKTITILTDTGKPGKQIFIKANVTNEVIEIYS